MSKKPRNGEYNTTTGERNNGLQRVPTRVCKEIRSLATPEGRKRKEIVKIIGINILE